MHPPADFPETPDGQRPPESRPAFPAPAYRSGPLRRLTLSIKFEIGRSGPQMGRMRAEGQTRPTMGDRFRGWLYRAVGEGLESRKQPPAVPTSDRRPRLEEPDEDPPRDPMVSPQATASFWETLTPAERRALESLASWVRFAVLTGVASDSTGSGFVVRFVTAMNSVSTRPSKRSVRPSTKVARWRATE